MRKFLTNWKYIGIALTVVIVVSAFAGVLATRTGIVPINPSGTPKPTSVVPVGTYVPVPASEQMHRLGYCTTGCGDLLIGNGICDPMCNNEYCNYDGGDCD